MVPVVAMVVAAVWLQEPISTMQIGGAVSIFAGVALTKVGRRTGADNPRERY